MLHTYAQKYFAGFILLLFVLLLSNCEEIGNEPAFDEVPNIRLDSLSTTTLVEFQDRLEITIAYEDGDGDLGNPDPDINSIFVKDSRLENEDEYYLGPLAPLDADVSIQGKINLVLSTTFLLGNGTQESTIYSIYLVDRAGNQSNTIETDEIIIQKQ